MPDTVHSSACAGLLCPGLAAAAKGSTVPTFHRTQQPGRNCICCKFCRHRSGRNAQATRVRRGLAGKDCQSCRCNRLVDDHLRFPQDALQVLGTAQEARTGAFLADGAQRTVEHSRLMLSTHRLWPRSCNCFVIALTLVLTDILKGVIMASPGSFGCSLCTQIMARPPTARHSPERCSLRGLNTSRPSTAGPTRFGACVRVALLTPHPARPSRRAHRTSDASQKAPCRRKPLHRATRSVRIPQR